VKFEIYIAERYLRSKRRTGFISLITYISAAGVMIGAAALVIVLSVMNGFESEVRERIIGADAHIKLTEFHETPLKRWPEITDSIRGIPHIVGLAPYIQGKGMIRRGQSIEGAMIKGIDPKLAGEVSDLPKTIVAGSLDILPTLTDEARRRTVIEDSFLRPKSAPPDSTDHKPLSGVVLGRQLAFRLTASVGDSVILISPTATASILSAPKMERFVVTGIFETGIYEYDDLFIYIPLESAQELFEMGSTVTGLELRLDDMNQAKAVADKIDDRLGYPYYPRTWEEMHRTLFRWMKIEKWMYTILMSLIILVAAFNIISSQIMVVLEKRREIGILKAMGATRESIMRIFMYEGLFVGLTGSFLGLLLGWVLCRLQQVYHFFSLPGDVYFLNSLPVRMHVLDFIIIGVVSLGLTLLATIYPARRAGKLDPVEAIRYE